MPQLYYRIQPKGLKLTHRSEGSDAQLPRGYVFVYKNVEEVVSTEAWSWIRFEIHNGADLEVVSLLGSGEFDPGDIEGVAVIPTSVRRREPLVQWLRAQGFLDEAEQLDMVGNNMPKKQKPVVIEHMLALLEQQYDMSDTAGWRPELSAEDYDELLGLLDDHGGASGAYLLIAAIAQIANDQGWMHKRVAEQLSAQATELLSDEWEAEAEREDERRADRR